MPEYRTLYRIVLTNPPTVQDMMSHHALGKRPRVETPELLRMWRGISLFDTMEQARTRSPMDGASIRCDIGDTFTQFHIEQTGRPGHHTLWGDAHDILKLVTRVQPV